VFYLVIVGISQSFAEPWLANRFAQNCAGCHAPSRRNLPAAERRCTLTCQGCHVNPNGGGLRSAYGKWNQKRWLRSIPQTVEQSPAKTPAPLPAQPYYQQPTGGSGQMPEGGYRLVTVDGVVDDESEYGRVHGQELVTVANRSEFLERIPAEDPYRREMRQLLTAGFDYRYIHEKVLAGGSIPAKTFSWPMALDIGLRLSPVPQSLDFVYEARFMQGPRDNDFFADHGKLVFGGVPFMRSAYGIWRNLPYNTYLMAGVYRPLFGYMTPDHTALGQKIAGFNQYTRHGAMTLGAAPNVPFVNLHGIFPYKKDGEYGGSSRGFAANLGGRFVTLGASIMASYWQTVDKFGEVETTRRLGSLNIGFSLDDLIVNFDYLRIAREVQPDEWARAPVYTVDIKHRLFREHYLTGTYEDSPELNLKLTEGWTRYRSLGFKSFWYAGLETELLYRLKSQLHANDQSTKDRFIQLMVHIYR
jgi:hypothetical protein